MTSLNEYSLQHGVAFGTSGVRARVSDLSHSVCYAFTRAFIDAICTEEPLIFVGIDLRPSSPTIAGAILQGIEDAGKRAVYCGQIPTPALAYYANSQSAPAIMITGSHIPFDRNGIKFYRRSGEISKQDEQQILARPVTAYLEQTCTPGELPLPDARALSAYQERYLNIFPSTLLQGKRIGIYEHSSVARDCLHALFAALGAHVVSIERTDTFVPIDTEAVSDEDRQKGREWAKRYALDAIVSTDGDADRPLIADETGEWLRGDIVGLLCARYLRANHVVTPVSSNTAVERYASGQTDMQVARTRIGSPYVIEAMNQIRANEPQARIIGYEANGGVLLGSDFIIGEHLLKALPTRDAVLPMLLVLASSCAAAQPISHLLQELPQRFTASDRLKEITTTKSQAYLAELLSHLERQLALPEMWDFVKAIPVTHWDTTDGLRITLANEDVIHLRPSGNAPELRCYVETDSQQKANRLVQQVLEHLEHAFH